MVKVHFDSITFQGNNFTIQSSAFCIHHRNYCSDLHQVLINFAINFKN